MDVQPVQAGRRSAVPMIRVPQAWRNVALLVAAFMAAIAVQAPVLITEPVFVGVNTAAVLLFLGLGRFLATRQGEPFTGACLIVSAGGWLVASLDIYPRWGTLLSWLIGGALVYTPIGWGILRYGRARLDRAGRAWVWLCTAGTAGTCLPLMLVSRPEWVDYPPDTTWFVLWPDETATAAINALACVGYLAIGICFAVLAFRRLRQAPPVQRSVLRPLTIAGAWWSTAAAVVTIVSALLPTELSIHANSNIVGASSVGVGCALVVAIARRRAQSATFVETLPTDRSPESLTDYARAALVDPTAELLFVVPGRSILIDGLGRLRDLPDPALIDRFTHWIVGSDGARVAVLTADPLMRDDPEAVRSFARVLSLAAENHQLHALSQMRLAQLTAARSAERMAFDRARERFRRDLHDGVQQTIAAARMDLDGVVDSLDALGPAQRASIDVRSADELDAKLRHALDQIRNLKKGDEPPELSTGLRAAIDRMLAELRTKATCSVCDDDLGALSVPVYFLVREAVTNAHKHARGATVEIVVEHRAEFVDILVRDHGDGGARPRAGGGLQGLADRVSELGGVLTVESPAGTGTTVHAVLPLAPA